MKNVLITGASGFVGKNMTAALRNIRDGKDGSRPSLRIGEIYLIDVDSSEAYFQAACEKADFVFNFAGVNRPKDESDFKKGNADFTVKLLSALKKAGNRCPVMQASSVQASLIGRYADGEYGKSKRAGEDAVFSYGRECGVEVMVYRFPNIFGKWCRPNYNSAVATFCHNTANGRPVSVNDPTVELELLYVDDLVREMLDALEGKAHRCEYADLEPVFCENGSFCAVPTTHKVTLGYVAELLSGFAEQPETLMIPEIPDGSFEKKLWSTYISYLPAHKVAFDLKKSEDDRGSFTELFKSAACGQVSVNITKPGVTKGQHWHSTKWEFFVVVAGHGLIRQRRIGDSEIIETEVSGERPRAVHMLPGYTHSITNLSKTDDLITVMWANESFDPQRPDTYHEEV